MPRLAFLLIIMLFSACFGLSGPVRGSTTGDSAQAPPPSRMLLLREAIALGIERNLNLQIDELIVPIRRQDVGEEDAIFDPNLVSRLSTGERQILTGAVLYDDDYQYVEETAAEVSLRKRFTPGLQGSLAFRTARAENNSLADSLNPTYRNYLIFNLTQPLLRDFGSEINTSRLHISKKRVESAVHGYLDSAQQLAADIERAYFDLVQARAELDFRVESRDLARDLVDDNRSRLRQGMIAISEVQQAETAVAGRDEKIITARQQVDLTGNRLKNLLEVHTGDPLDNMVLTTEKAPGIDIVYPNESQAIELALRQRQDLQQLRLELESQDIRLAYLENQKLPRLDLAATLGVNGLAGGDRPVTLFGGNQSSALSGSYGDSYSSLVEDRGHEWAIDLTLTYPIGNRAAEARYFKGKMEKRQLLLRLKKVEGSIETTVKNALVAIGASLERIEVSKRFEQLAQTTLDQEMVKLERGLSNTFRILDFQDDLISARIKKSTALTGFHQGLATLYREIGGNLERYGITAEVDRSLLGDAPLPEYRSQ